MEHPEEPVYEIDDGGAGRSRRKRVTNTRAYNGPYGRPPATGESGDRHQQNGAVTLASGGALQVSRRGGLLSSLLDRSSHLVNEVSVEML